MSMEVILLERVDNLGDLGDVVSVKPGYARNFLIPQQKALRANDANLTYFKAQKTQIEKKNKEKKSESEKQAKKLEGLKVAIIRHAGEGGQLYGSVTARDIAESIGEVSGVKIRRSMVTIHEALKMIGLFPVTIALHPEVKLEVTINIARSEDEAKLQEKTGKALIAEEEGESQAEMIEKAEEKAEEKAQEAKEEFLEDSALEAEKEEAARQAEEKAKKEAEAKEAEEAEKAGESAEEDPADNSEASSKDSSESEAEKK